MVLVVMVVVTVVDVVFLKTGWCEAMVWREHGSRRVLVAGVVVCVGNGLALVVGNDGGCSGASNKRNDKSDFV